MLKIRRVEIDNFACFERIEIEPSTNPEKPLTVVRAENGSGKTTLLRAIRWGMYGEKGLPGNAGHFSLHPAEWRPDESGIRTKVSILFETDGSSRDHPEGNLTNTAYELRRSVTTVAKEPSRAGEPDFRRINEEAQLLVEEPDGSWQPHDTGVDSVVAELLPWNLRDFFVMDTDEAADYVGGSENKAIQRQEVIAKTSLCSTSVARSGCFREGNRSGAGDRRGVRAGKHQGRRRRDLNRKQEEWINCEQEQRNSRKR